MKHSLLLVYLVGLFVACQDYSGQTNQRTEYFYNIDSSMVVSMPYEADLKSSTSTSMTFEYDKKLCKIIKADITDSWNLLGLVQDMAGNSLSKLTLVESSDSLVAYKFSNGQFSFIAHVASQFKRDGYSILLVTYGIEKKQHQDIASSIRCDNKNIDGNSIYIGDYISCIYPSSWNVDESPGTMTADVYISNSDHSFGVWFFKFENDDPFKERMNELADNWKEYAKVNITYVKYKGIEWCKQDLRIGDNNKQISFYTQKGRFIYNVKFGNQASKIDQSIIDTVMESVKISD